MCSAVSRLGTAGWGDTRLVNDLRRILALAPRRRCSVRREARGPGGLVERRLNSELGLDLRELGSKSMRRRSHLFCIFVCAYWASPWH